jgi:hypothetical protein
MATQLNIKDAEVATMARRIARKRGISITRAIRDSLASQPDAAPSEDEPFTPEQQRAYDILKAIGDRNRPRAQAAGITSANMADGIYDYLYEPDFKG